MTATQSSREPVYFSIDRGGTFTDIYACRGNRVFSEKLLFHDPANYQDAPGNIPPGDIGWIRMGTTVATNALLERKGTDCALAITRGFGDLLCIG